MSTPQPRPDRDWIGLAAAYAAPLFLAALVLVFAALEPRFLHPLNLMNILRQVSISGLIALGMTFVILTRGIDLSVGAIVAFSGLVAAYVYKGGLEDRFTMSADAAAGAPALVALAAAVATGAACGAAQGLAVARLAVPAFVVTLGGMSAFRGAALMFSDGGPISGFGPDFAVWGQGRIADVPAPVIVFALVALAAHLVLRHTRFGLHVYAIGGDPAAAGLNGVDGRRVTLAVYVIVGALCGLAAFLLAARLNSAEAVAGLGLELDVIAAVVIGGTSLFGGVGGVGGTVIGALLIGVLRNGLVLLNVSSFAQQIVIGVVLVGAVALDQLAKRRR